jgi:hypothetical protein
MNLFYLHNSGVVLRTVSSGKYDVPKPNASSGKQKKSVGDDAKDEGVSSPESITLNPISSGILGQSNPSAAAQVAAPVLPTGKRGRNSPLPATKRNRPLD